MGEESSQAIKALGQVLLHANAYADTMLLKCAVRLGLADIVHATADAGITLPQLAKSLPFHPVNIQNLARIMRCLVHMGLFANSATANGEDVVFKPTIASQFILKNGKKSILPLLVPMMEDWAVSPWHCLDAALDGKKHTTTPFEMKHGCSLWEAGAKQPELGRLFNDSMANDTAVLMPAVMTVCKEAFQRIGSLVDVGGGTGMAAAHIAAAFPHVKCSVLDLPHVVVTTVGYPNVECVPGDIFTSIPHADALFLKRILHDWDDDECMKILKRCKEALPKEGGMVIIVEIVLGEEMDGEDGFRKINLTTDIAMMVFTGGKERTSEEWKLLLGNAGFYIYKITPILLGRSVIEAHPLP